MTLPFDPFCDCVHALRPRTAIVLGSGLTGVTDEFIESATVHYGDIPGLVPPTIAGHKGQLSVGVWNAIPVLVCFGRVHFYEGHPWDRVTRLINLVADLGVKRVILTNAAGGIHPALNPGSVMGIRAHMKWLGARAWREDTTSNGVYMPALIAKLQSDAPDLLFGTYAALTGPCYETPAEIRALRNLGADAVGMSTAMEAEAAAARGLEVAGLSCITNKAAGISDGPLSHKEVEATAKLAVGRMADLVARLL